MSHPTTHTAAPKKHHLEYFLVTVFSFLGLGLLSLFVLNFSLFDPFTLAFRDFSLTDIYYSKMQNRDRIYPGPIVLVGAEDRSREEIAFLLQRIQEGTPKVVGLDIIFPERKDSSDEALRSVFAAHNNFVLPYSMKMKGQDTNVYTHAFFGDHRWAYVNLIGEDKRYSTVRSYYPLREGSSAFTTEIIRNWDEKKLPPLLAREGKETDIRYWGNLQNFRYHTFDEIMNPAFDPAAFKNSIVLVGYLGTAEAPGRALDDDRFFTPLNLQVAGRSHPDMYGIVIHANILRMALDGDYTRKLPTWIVWILAFGATWLLVPPFVRWYVHKPMWSHFLWKVSTLALSILFMYLTILLYAKANLKIESAAILIAILLLGDFILFWDGLVKFVQRKLKWNINSKFFAGHGH